MNFETGGVLMSDKYINVKELINFIDKLPYSSIIEKDIKSFIDSHSVGITEWNLDLSKRYFIEVSCDGMTEDECQRCLLNVKQSIETTYSECLPNVIYKSTSPKINIKEAND